MLQWKAVVSVLVLVSTAVEVQADVYMHNPRGANDRNCETDENRRNVRFNESCFHSAEAYYSQRLVDVSAFLLIKQFTVFIAVDLST